MLHFLHELLRLCFGHQTCGDATNSAILLPQTRHVGQHEGTKDGVRDCGTCEILSCRNIQQERLLVVQTDAQKKTLRRSTARRSTPETSGEQLGVQCQPVVGKEIGDLLRNVRLSFLRSPATKFLQRGCVAWRHRCSSHALPSATCMFFGRVSLNGADSGHGTHLANELRPRSSLEDQLCANSLPAHGTDARGFVQQHHGNQTEQLPCANFHFNVGNHLSHATRNRNTRADDSSENEGNHGASRSSNEKASNWDQSTPPSLSAVRFGTLGSVSVAARPLRWRDGADVLGRWR